MNDKFYLINEKIKNHDNIIIAHHIGPDLDSLGSSFALQKAIKEKYANKKVLVIGSTSKRFMFLPIPEKESELENPLLIVLDTPNISRIDIKNFYNYLEVIKIDHHPFIEKFSDLEYIDTSVSSTAEIIFDFLKKYNFNINEEIAKYLFMGIVTDTNRFLYSLSKNTLNIASYLINEFSLNTKEIYDAIYNRPLKELKVENYIFDHFTITESGMASIIIDDNMLKELDIQPSLPGNIINNLNNINEVYVWFIATEDVKNNYYKVNIRSRGPIVNKIAEKYNGGGHELASGARISNLDDVKLLIKELEQACLEYKKEIKNENNFS